MNPKTTIEEWKSQGRMIKILDHDIFVVDTATDSEIDLPVLVILHGYPSSSYDYVHVLPLLRDKFRIILHDHPGFGLSGKPLDYSYSLLKQADVALELWKQLGLRSVHLAAHDYGTSVATEILAKRIHEGIDVELRSITLSNGSIHIELAKLRFIQKLLRNRFWGPLVAKLGNQTIYVHQMRRLWYDKRKCNTDELKALWQMGSSGNGRKVLPQITQYLNERYTYWDRWIGALKELDIPAHILWAQEDPVAIAAIGEQLYNEIPGASIIRLANIGHYPMLEDPVEWAEKLKNFIEPLINVE